MAEKEKKKRSGFDLNKYKTHDGERGSAETWVEGMSQLLGEETKEEKKKKLEKSLTKTVRKIQID